MVALRFRRREKPAHQPTRTLSMRAFTLIELLVVLAIIAMVGTSALPRYLHSVERSKEAVGRQDLSVMRDALDKFDGDRDRYPNSLEELVEKGYLRKIPPDPITDRSTTWQLDPDPDTSIPGIYDIH